MSTMNRNVSLIRSQSFSCFNYGGGYLAVRTLLILMPYYFIVDWANA